MVGLTEGVIGDFPVQPLFDSHLSTKHIAFVAAAGQFFRKSSQQLIRINFSIRLRVYPEKAIFFQCGKLDQTITGFIDSAKLCFLGHCPKLA